MNWLIVLVILIVGCDAFGNIPRLDVVLLPFCIYGFFRCDNIYTSYGRSILVVLFSILLSTVSCYLFRGQSFVDSFMALRFFWLLSLFFFLVSKKPRLTDVIKGLKCFYFVYISLYVLKTIFPSLNIGPSNASLTEMNSTSSSDFVGFYILGLYITVFGFCYYLNRFFLSRKIINILYLSGALFVWFYSLSRTNLAACCIVFLYSIYHYSKMKKIGLRTILAIILAFYFIYNIPIIKQASQQIVLKQTEGSNLDNDSYIRVIQFDYFVNEHFKSPVEVLLGSGMPHGNSAYGQMMLSHGEVGGIKTGWYDWGMIGLSWVLGITSVLSLLFLYWKAFRRFVSNQLFFVNLIYLFFIVSAPFAILSFDSGGFVMQSFLLYLISISANDFNNNSFVQQRKNNKRNNSFSM